ncbi:kinesin-like protein CG14535 isoform X1 [Centruroides vittatus]|uniref:kinesin-like protein CG14535 isoform X1 n=2 Tax=Centruroides vittatus TaxID=120091 RepID=UPI00350F1A2B
MVQSGEDRVPKSDSDPTPPYHHHRHYHHHVYHHAAGRTSKIPIPVSPTTRMTYNRPNATPTLYLGYRMPRPSKVVGSGLSAASPPTSVPYPLAQQAQQYLEQNIKTWMQPAGNQTFSTYSLSPIRELPRYSYGHMSNPTTTMTGITQKVLQEHNLAQMYQAVQGLPHQEIPTTATYLHGVSSRNPFPHSLSFSGYSHHSMIQSTSYSSPCTTGYALTQPSAAASFFARAAQRLNLSSKKKRHMQGMGEAQFRTRFHEILRVSPPPAPPVLLRVVNKKDTGIGKVKVMLRLCPTSESSDSFLTIDSRKKQVTVYDPLSCGTSTPVERRAGVSAPKMFAFDAVFSQDDTQAEMCSNSLTDVVQSVVNGNDGCLFVYGYPKLGKTYTMLGRSDSVQELGVIPCAISWLFKLINEHKQKTGARFSVRVSAVEVSGRQETLRDLLSDYVAGGEGNCTSPGVYLREDPIFGSQLMNQSELRAPNAEKAAYLLDAALSARSTECEEESRNSHFLFTLHVYQYRVEKGTKGGVVGGRSRLHLLDLGSCEKQSKGRDATSGACLSLSALGNVILALFNGQKHVPYKDSKLTQVLREVLGSLTCRAAMIAHVSAVPQHYAETLATIQLAARIHRMRRKKLKYFSSNTADMEERGIRVHEEGVRSGSSDPDYTSSSEQSCDTVIYVGSGGVPLSDRELTDNEGPPAALPILPKTNKTDTPINKQNENAKLAKDRIFGQSGVVLQNPHNIRLNKEEKNRSVKSTDDKHVPLGGVINIVQKPPTAIHLPKKIHLKHHLWTTSKQEIQEGIKELKCQSDEMWIDGPRFTKPKFDTRTLHHLQKEQWVDGPAIYGYMDDQKQDMIQKWIEEHSRNPQENLQEVWVDCPPAVNLLNGILEKYVPNTSVEQQDSVAVNYLDQEDEISSESESEANKREFTKHFDLLSEESCAGICNSLQNISAIPEVHEFQNKNAYGDDNSSTSADVDDLDNDDDDDEDDDIDDNQLVGDQVQYEEPISTQDCCLQVTEDDILASLWTVKEELMGDLEVESSDGSDHPLHILSEEDLNLASSFTDSCSVSVDLETVSVPDASPGVTWALLQGRLFQKTDQTSQVHNHLLAEKLKALADYREYLDMDEGPLWTTSNRVSKTCSLPAHLAQLAMSQLLRHYDPDMNSICSEPAQLDAKKLPWSIHSGNGLKLNSYYNKLQRVSLSVDHAFHAKPTQIVPPLVCLARDNIKKEETTTYDAQDAAIGKQTSKISTVRNLSERENKPRQDITVLRQPDGSSDPHLNKHHSATNISSELNSEGKKNEQTFVEVPETPKSKPSKLSKFLGVKGRKEKSSKKRAYRNNEVCRGNSSPARGQGSDSDTITSGYPSPYTKSWVLRNSSSGHGSDSSLTSTDIRETKELLGKCGKVQQFSGTSSGYESMPRDSEGTPLSSSSQESARGTGKKDGRKTGKKKSQDSNKRNRSASSRHLTSSTSINQHPCLVEQQPGEHDAQHKLWDNRNVWKNEEDSCCAGFLCCKFLDFY